MGTAKEILKGGAEVKRGSTYEIPYRTTSMDICLCLDVFERIDDDTRAVSEIARVLKPGGIPVTGGPATYYWSQYEKLIGHFRQYTRRSLEDLLQSAAFAVYGLSLPNYPNWHLAYSRRYCWVRFLSRPLGPLMARRNVRRFKWLWG